MAEWPVCVCDEAPAASEQTAKCCRCCCCCYCYGLLVLKERLLTGRDEAAERVSMD